MLTLIYGGSSSGKSAFAEDYVCKTNWKNKYYLATMSAYDQESKERVERHRNLRKGKDFVTLEYPRDIADAIPSIVTIDAGDFSLDAEEQENNVVLIECMSNLVANEMFRDGQVYPSDYVTHKILQDLHQLKKEVPSIVIVTNNVFEDCVSFDEGTKDYLRALGEINKKIAELADEVYEVVVGIPIPLKNTKG